MSEGGVVASFVVPVHPHTVLAPDMNPGWRALRDAYDEAAQTIRDLEADLLIIYSTTWPSIIGHQIQADPNPEWVMVDHDFHDLGSIPYSFNIDAEFAHAWDDANRNRGLQSRCVNYKGFPIDVGSVVALTLLNPDNTIPAVIVSSNMYANRSETTVLAKSCLDVIKAQGRRAVAITAMSLSNRMFTDFIEPADDKIHSLKDDEWNRKILEFLEEGRLEDVGQLSRTIHQQIRVQGGGVQAHVVALGHERKPQRLDRQGPGLRSHPRSRGCGGPRRPHLHGCWRQGIRRRRRRILPRRARRVGHRHGSR